MAFITIYNPDPTEQQQYDELFSGTNHQHTFMTGPISSSNINSESEVIAIFVTDKITRDILEKLPKLQLIATQSTGFDHIDLEAAAERGVIVLNVPTYGEKTVAEYTLALLLAISRRVGGGAHLAAFGAPIDYRKICGFDLDGKTMGLIGAGKIGQHVAALANAFGMNVVVYDPYPDEIAAEAFGFTYVTLAELAKQSDVISLHAPSTDDNYHLIDSSFFAGVKSNAVLVNTARGELVDLTALATALQDGKISGAALDVLEHEELLQQNLQEIMEDSMDERASIAKAIFTLKRTRNVIITPHNGFNTQEALLRIKQITVQNIIDFYKGKTPNKVKV